MSKSLVPEGALLVCNKGSDIVELKVTNEEKIFIKDKAHANEKDNKFIENIPSFKECSIFGQCEHTTFSLWQNHCPNVTVGKKAKKLIKEDSTLKCKKVSDVESSRGDFRTTSSTGEVRVFLEGQAAIDALYGNDYYESMLLKDSVNSFLAGLIPGAIIGAISCYIPGVESLMSKINPDIMVMVGAKTTADRLNSSNRTWEDFIRERGIKDEKVKEMYMKHADRVVLLENAGMFAGAYGVNKLLNLRGSSALVNEASVGNIEEGSDLASMKNVKQKGTVNWSGKDTLKSSEVRNTGEVSDELLQKVKLRRDVVIAKKGTDDYRFMEFSGSDGSAGGIDNKHILLRENPAKLTVVEEFLHGTQVKYAKGNKIPIEASVGIDKSYEIKVEWQVRDFMYRHKKIFGWNEAELGVLKSELDYWGSLNKN